MPAERTRMRQGKSSPAVKPWAFTLCSKIQEHQVFSVKPTMGGLEREEEVLVLFGSQRGTAEKMAESLVERLPQELTPESIQARTGTHEVITVIPRLMALDDFLEEGCRWTRTVIVVVSSFGMGGAPMNARRFRRACEDWVAELKDGSRDSPFLDGLRFAILGYGDRHYKTYQRNPIVIEEALTMAGAKIIGRRGESDADLDPDVNEKAISRWVESLWSDLAECLVEEPLPEEVLGQMQLYTEVSV